MNRPRLGAKEAELWHDFIAAHGSLYTDYQYDVRVMSLADIVNNPRGHYRADWSGITCPRLDAAAKDAQGHSVLFEVRPDGNSDALLRLIGYSELLMKLGTIPGQSSLALVCRRITTTTAYLCKRYNVRVFIVPPSVSTKDTLTGGKLPPSA